MIDRKPPVLVPPPKRKPSLNITRFSIELKDSGDNGLLVDFGENVISTWGDTILEWVVKATLKNATFESLGKNGDSGGWRFNRDRTCIILAIGPIDVFVLLGIDRYPLPGQGGSGRYVLTPAKDALTQPIYWQVQQPLPD